MGVFRRNDVTITPLRDLQLSTGVLGTLIRQPMLYTPPIADGASGRPNDYGFGTLVNADAARIYIDHLTDLPSQTARVWLISSSVQPDDFSSIPARWNKAQDITVDDTQARLYLTCTGADCAPPDWRPSHARANP